MFNSLDYSNYLLSNNKRLIKKKYAIYLDCPLPGSSDNNFFNLNFPFNTKKWFKSLNVFFFVTIADVSELASCALTKSTSNFLYYYCTVNQKIRTMMIGYILIIY